MIHVVAAGGGGSVKAAPKSHGMSFGEILSCLNPLQYVPVVGTIYRAVTGDTIPDGVREAGSLVFSGLTSGPLGLATSIGVDLAERATGIDPDKIGQRMLAAIGIGSGHAEAGPTAASATALAQATNAAQPLSQAASSQVAFSQAELGGAGGVIDAEALNGMELRRLASNAYAKAAMLAA